MAANLGLSRLASRRVVVGVLLACTLVAAAYGSAWDGEFATSEPGLTQEAVPAAASADSSWLGSALFGIMVLIALGVAIAAIYRGVDPKALAVLVAAIAVVGILASFLSPAEEEVDVATSEPTDSQEPPPRATGGAIGWWLGLAGLAVALPAAAVAWRLRPQEQASAEEATLGEQISMVAQNLERSPANDREAIVMAYSDLETLLGDHGMWRMRSETSNEYIGRTARLMGAGSDDAVELAAIYERATFGVTDEQVAGGALARDRARAAALIAELSGVRL